MATNLEDKLISAVLNDAQIHVLLQADATKLFRTHGDVWEFVRKYYEQNQVVPTVNLVKEKFIDFEPQVEIGATKHHLDELRQDFLRDNLRNTLRTAATAVQDGETVEALDQLIADAAELKRVTSEVRDLDVADIDNALDYFEQVRLLNESGSHGIRTGLPGFDNYLPAGITPGQLGVLLAYPAIGKSWFVVYMAAQAWMQGRSPLIISMEMTEQEVRNRFFTVLGAGLWRHRKLSRGEVELDQMKAWNVDGYTASALIAYERVLAGPVRFVGELGYQMENFGIENKEGDNLIEYATEPAPWASLRLITIF